MYMIHPIYLLDVLERLEEGEIPNQIIVPEEEKKLASIALNRMLSILEVNYKGTMNIWLPIIWIFFITEAK